MAAITGFSIKTTHSNLQAESVLEIKSNSTLYSPGHRGHRGTALDTEATEGNTLQVTEWCQRGDCFLGGCGIYSRGWLGYGREGGAPDLESDTSWSLSWATSWSVTLGTLLPFYRRKAFRSSSVYRLLPWLIGHLRLPVQVIVTACFTVAQPGRGCVLVHGRVPSTGTGAKVLGKNLSVGRCSINSFLPNKLPIMCQTPHILYLFSSK